MPPYYDIYGLSYQRDKTTVERFLDYFSIREKIENKEGQDICVYKNEKYNIDKRIININTLTEVIKYGIDNENWGFVFYIGDHLKDGINHIILKFTYDGKIIFGISVAEQILKENGNLIDNYKKALEIERSIAMITNSIKTSIQFEYAPSDDEEEFDSDIELWRDMNEEKLKEISKSI